MGLLISIGICVLASTALGAGPVDRRLQQSSGGSLASTAQLIQSLDRTIAGFCSNPLYSQSGLCTGVSGAAASTASSSSIPSNPVGSLVGSVAGGNAAALNAFGPLLSSARVPTPWELMQQQLATSLMDILASSDPVAQQQAVQTLQNGIGSKFSAALAHLAQSQVGDSGAHQSVPCSSRNLHGVWSSQIEKGSYGAGLLG